MALKKLLVLLNLFFTIESKGITFVIDTAASMTAEIETLQLGLTRFFDGISSQNEVEKFVVIPFNEPDIGPITITRNGAEFKTAIRSLTAKGSRDCPTISMEALQYALDSSEDKSYIYFFTDAYTNDLNSINFIKEQCQRSSSQVSIILTRTCYPNNSGFESTVQYQEIVDACGGQLIAINPYNLRHVFKYIQEQLKWEQQDFSVDEAIRCDNQKHRIPIDKSSSEVLILMNGNVYYIEVRDENNITKAENIINSRTFKAYHINKPKDVTIKCRGDKKTTIKIASKNHIPTTSKLPFSFGFSTFKPTIMKETTLKPSSSWNVYMLVAPLEKSLIPVKIEIISLLNKEDKRTLNLTETYAGSKFYVTEAFYIPSNSFKIVIYAYALQGKTYELRNFSTEYHLSTVEEIRSMKPNAKVIEINRDDVEYGGERSIACLVIGYPKPVIWWQDDSNNLRYDSVMNILEYPNVYISHVKITNITRNITYSCHAYNSEGSHQQFGSIVVKFTPRFDIIEKPKDMTVEIDDEATLDCKVDAIPKATVTWYFNNTILEYKNNIDIKDDKLIITSMSLDDIGLYSCEVRNGFQSKRFDAKISITGLEAPIVFFNTSDMIQVTIGSSLDITCGYKGKPTPTITWKFMHSEDGKLEDLPSDVSAYDDHLSIFSVKPHHRGIYRCEADNVIGSNCKDIQLMVGAPPIITEDVSSLTTRMRYQVELHCEVQSDTSVRVHWELKKNYEDVPLGYHQVTNAQNTLRFIAQWNDGGIYTCIAENEAGVAEKSIDVTVLVPPYIQTQSPKIMTVEEGSSISIPCELLYGNPTPEITWRFKPIDSPNHISLSPESPDALNLPNVSASNEGEYLCTAKNEVGSDEIKVILRLNTNYEIV